VRLDGDEMPADADDGDAGHSTRTYICRLAARPLQGAEPQPRRPAGTRRGRTSPRTMRTSDGR
jgi:hypothetical protein